MSLTNFIQHATPVILSSSEDRDLLQDDLRRALQHFDWLSVTKEILEGISIKLRKYNLIYLNSLSRITPVILSLSKDGVLMQDNLRRIPQHFDRLSVTKEILMLKLNYKEGINHV